MKRTIRTDSVLSKSDLFLFFRVIVYVSKANEHVVCGFSNINQHGWNRVNDGCFVLFSFFGVSFFVRVMKCRFVYGRFLLLRFETCACLVFWSFATEIVQFHHFCLSVSLNSLFSNSISRFYYYS